MNKEDFVKLLHSQLSMYENGRDIIRAKGLSTENKKRFLAENAGCIQAIKRLLVILGE